MVSEKSGSPVATTSLPVVASSGVLPGFTGLPLASRYDHGLFALSSPGGTEKVQLVGYREFEVRLRLRVSLAWSCHCQRRPVSGEYVSELADVLRMVVVAWRSC